MPETPSRTEILVADDDSDDRLMMKEALEESGAIDRLRFVCDGEELMDYLNRRGAYAGLAGEPLPGLVLLDLHMPKMDGREALQEIKSHPRLKRIPIVVLTTSRAEEDIERCYELGSNSYITKPVTFAGLIEAMKELRRYWLEIVELPSQDSGG